MARSSGDLPSHGPPDSIAEKKDEHGNIVQRRHYGSDGRALKNIDYGHDHTGIGDPHAHDWDWNQPKEKRLLPRTLQPGE